MTRQPLAIVGIGLRFPGANDLPSYWQLLREGRRAISLVPKERFDVDAYFDPNIGVLGKISSRFGGFIDDALAFDHDFFGISAKEARALDPQQLLLLELAWQALEDAGITREALGKRRIGVFVGASSVDAHNYALPPYTHLDAYASTGLTLNTLANRISYVLDLLGPSFVVDSACSASLTALHLACQSVWSGESEAALVGGVALHLAPGQAVVESQAGLLTPSGHCRPFDAKAEGIVRGEGAAVIIVKPLADALRDCDHIYAEIAATGVSHNGRTQGLSQTSASAQQALLEGLLRDAALNASDIGFVEAHGTAMPAGDVVELNAISAALKRAPDAAKCWIGSLKANIGHLESAAGIAAIVKACLVLEHGVIPPQVDFTQLPEGLALSPHGLDIPLCEEALQAHAAIVNGLGFGGANAAALLRRHEGRPVAYRAERLTPLVLPLSAADDTALRALARGYTGSCAATALHRSALKETATIVASDAASFAHALQAVAEGTPHAHVIRQRRRRPLSVAFVFPGHGPVWTGVHRRLGPEAQVFHARLAEAERIIIELADWSLVATLDAPELLTRTDFVQPVLCAAQMALCDQVRAWGLEPTVLVGHSGGEMAATYCAGMVSFRDALRTAVVRGRHMHQTFGEGGLYAVIADAAKAQTILAMCDRAAVAGYNGPKQTIFSVRNEDRAALEEVLDALQVDFHPTEVPYPFHSPALKRLGPAMTAELSWFRAAEPLLPIVSTLSGELLSSQALDHTYWFRQALAPVLFAQAIDKTGADVFIEIGPDTTLTHLLKQMRLDAVSVLADNSLARVLGEAWGRGATVEWRKFYGVDRAPFADLPRYPWQRRRTWPFAPFERESAAIVSEHGRTLPPLFERKLRPRARGAKRPAQTLVLVASKRASKVMTALRKVHPKAVQITPLQLARWAKPDVCFIFAAALGDSAITYKKALALLVAANVPARVVWWTRFAHAVEQELPQPDQAYFLGLARSMRLEHRQLFGTIIDADEPTSLAATLALSALPDECAVRAGRLFTHALVPVGASPLPVLLRRDSSYVVTGGLGGIGFAIAKRIARSGARVVIFTRRKLPERHAKLLELEREGGEVSIVSLDVSQAGALQRWLAKERRERRRPVRGVFHCAALEAARPLLETDSAHLALHARAKVQGFEALKRTFVDVDFVVSLSSVSALFGGVWQAAYAAANSKLEALTLAATGKPRFACVAFGPVLAGGLDAEGARIESMRRLGHDPLTVDEAVDAVFAATDANVPRLMWSMRSDFSRIAPQLGSPAVLSELVPVRAALVQSSSPATEPQQRLLAIARDVLVQPKLQLDDDLFEHGATSFAVMQLIAQARSSGMALSPSDVFRTANVRMLASRPDVVTKLRTVAPTAAQKRLLGTEVARSALVLPLPAGTQLEQVQLHLEALAVQFPALRVRATRMGEQWTLGISETLTPSQIVLVKRRQSTRAQAELLALTNQLRLDASNEWVRFVVFADGFFSPTHVALIASPLALDAWSQVAVANALLGTAQVAAPPKVLGQLGFEVMRREDKIGPFTRPPSAPAVEWAGELDAAATIVAPPSSGFARSLTALRHAGRLVLASNDAALSRKIPALRRAHRSL